MDFNSHPHKATGSLLQEFQRLVKENEELREALYQSEENLGYSNEDKEAWRVIAGELMKKMREMERELKIMRGDVCTAHKNNA